jgi:hypothetical protein
MAKKLPWLKIHYELPDDDKFVGREQKWRDIGVWVALLCKAHRSPIRGSLYISLSRLVTPEWLRDYTSLSRADVDELLQFFRDNDMIHDDENGAMVITHYFERQYDKPSDRPNAAKERKAKSRLCHAVSRLDTDTDTDTDTDIPPNPQGGKRVRKSRGNEYTPEFEEFWREYPRNIKKRAAFENWNTRLKEGVSPSDLILAAKVYRCDRAANETPENLIMHPTTFLSHTRAFEDYLTDKMLKKAEGYQQYLAMMDRLKEGGK